MHDNPRYLTKSRFQLAADCPTKLFYTGKPEYPDKKVEDTFLMALAYGGFQVGELAKQYFPDGVSGDALAYEQALAQTESLMRAEQVTIFEAAIKFENFFVRIDVLVKNGNDFELIEVKSKSYDGFEERFTKSRGGGILSKWKPYLYDVAFQKYVLQSAFPAANVSAFLMMADKSSTCPTDGLNQKFRVTKDANGRKRTVVVSPVTSSDLTPPILGKVNVDAECDVIYSTADGADDEGRSFAERAHFYSESYARDERIAPLPGTICKGCEFRATPEERGEGKKDGFRECWMEKMGWSDADFDEPTILDVWKYPSTRKEQLFLEGRIKMRELTELDITQNDDGKPGISQGMRQWLQVQKARDNDRTPWLDREGLAAEMSKWAFPLHFIDFETSMAAIPFNRGRRPYEGIAFQFSHHVVHADGLVEHAGEFLNVEPGKFPNYDFVRALRSELEWDTGSIFRFADHENSYLNMVYAQLAADPQPPSDADALREFIRTISKSKKDHAEPWEGERNMIDICRLVMRHYYDPATNGSNSIKKVLPAILNSSEYLQKKYSQPIYGSVDGIPSKNFVDWTWIQIEDGMVRDPYQLLPKMFDDVSDRDLELLSGDDDELNDGGAAMTAYGRLQFEDMSDYERDAISAALLKYCELDTLAMVMIYEAWREMLKQ